MQHLSIERLAELGDVDPTRDETEHLASCAQCARERAAYRRLAALAGDERSRIGPPLTDWNALSARLSEAGLVREGRSARASTLGVRRVWQVAAAVVFAVAGIYAGRVSAGLSYREALALRPVAEEGADLPAAEYSSPDEALAALNRAYNEYSSAATYLAATDTVSSGEAFERFRARLAFLDEVAQRSREALAEAPQDPFINQFYVSTLGARDATLHRMGQIVPVGNRLGRF
jgi:hypothetical protein